MKPYNRHGSNPALHGLNGQAIKAILKNEERLRSSGEWGSWEHLEPHQFQSLLARRSGWVLDVKRVHRNKVFSVLERPDKTGVIHAAICSLSGLRPSWYETQRIKDELFGLRSTAVEIYPPHDEIVDGSDTYHLWILPKDLPFSLHRLERSSCAGCEEVSAS